MSQPVTFLMNVSIYQRDYSTFSSESFCDVSIQNWNYSHDNVHDSFIDFYTKLERSVNRHAPLSPKEIKVKNKAWYADILEIRTRQPNNENCKRLIGS